MLNFEDLKTIEVNCKTENIPAPYSYTYSLRLDIDRNQGNEALLVEYNLKYTDRDDLEEEDIIDEGFSLNDDYSWKGQLPKVWLEELKELFRKTTWKSKAPEVSTKTTASLKLKTIDNKGDVQSIFPANQELWEYFLQEMIQAVYEISQKEYPLEVRYKEIDSNKKETTILIQPFFSSRTVEIKVEKEQNALEQKQIPWNNLKPLLKSVYFPDYDYQYALEVIPKKAGKYIDNGEGVWYEFGVGVKNPNKNINSLEKLERSLKELVRE